MENENNLGRNENRQSQRGGAKGDAVKMDRAVWTTATRAEDTAAGLKVCV